MEYFVGSGEVAGGLVQDETTMCAGTGFGYGPLLSASTYAVGQPVKINFNITNLSAMNMTITSSTSCLGNFTVLQIFLGPVVYDSAKHPVCTGHPLKVVLRTEPADPSTYQPFPSGAYTVVAADEWGQVAILHFIVAG